MEQADNHESGFETAVSQEGEGASGNKENGMKLAATINACYHWISDNDFLHVDKAVQLYEEKHNFESAPSPPSHFPQDRKPSKTPPRY